MDDGYLAFWGDVELRFRHLGENPEVNGIPRLGCWGILDAQEEAVGLFSHPINELKFTLQVLLVHKHLQALFEGDAGDNIKGSLACLKSHAPFEGYYAYQVFSGITEREPFVNFNVLLRHLARINLHGRKERGAVPRVKFFLVGFACNFNLDFVSGACFENQCVTTVVGKGDLDHNRLSKDIHVMG